MKDSVDRIKSIIDSAGNDLSAANTKAIAPSTASTAQAATNTATKEKQPIQQKEYPRTNDQPNVLLSLVGIGLVSSSTFGWYVIRRRQ